MVFDIEKPKEWLILLLDEPSASIEEQQKRDAKLMATFFDTGEKSLSKSGRLGRLRALPGLRSALQANDVTRLLEWLPQTREALGTEVTANTSQSFLWNDYGDSLDAIALLSRSEQIRPLFETWHAVAHPIERERLAGAAYGFPWFRWVFTEPQEVVAWLRLLLGSSQVQPPAADVDSTATIAPRTVSREDEMLAFALFTIASELKDKAPDLLDDALRVQR